MTPYRTPAPHVCRYDVIGYMPPHHVYNRCVCGAVKPPTFVERVLDVVVDLLVGPFMRTWLEEESRRDE